jgi:hypothetical protein
MPGPRTKQDIFDSFAEGVSDSTASLPGPEDTQIDSFSPGPPPDLEYSVADWIATQARYLEHYNLAALLSSFAEWVGREITEDDLPELADTFNLNAEAIDPAIYNQYVEPEHLDAFGINQGVRRIPAKQATGTVTVFVRDNSVAVPEDTVVTTNAVGGDPAYRYRITETRYPNQGETVVRDIPIVARVGGIGHNIGAGRITQFENDRAGLDDVTNTQPITGGEREETDAEFRERARRAFEFNSEGPTEQGVIGELYREFSGLETDDMAVVPRRDPTADDNELGQQYSEVIVDGGGTNVEIEAVLDEWGFPAEFVLSRPDRHPIDVTATLRPTQDATEADINVDRAEDAVLRWLSEFGIGEGMSLDRLRYIAIASDPEDIGDIDSLSVTDTATGTQIPPADDLEGAIGERDKIVAGTVAFTTGG